MFYGYALQGVEFSRRVSKSRSNIIQIMKQTKLKAHRGSLAQLYKDKSKEILKAEPKNYLANGLKDNQFSLDITQFVPEDLPAFQLITTHLPLQKIIIISPENNEKNSLSKSRSKDPQVLQIKTYAETPKFKDFVHCLSLSMESNSSLKILRIQKIMLSVKAMKQFNQGLIIATSLRQLSIVSCGLTEEHVDQIKKALAQNKSLITVDFSHNNLCDIGGMIGSVLSQHSRRRNQVVFFLSIRGEMPAEDISNSGLVEINLQNNKINDKAVFQLTNYLKADSWIKCLNLRRNEIKLQGVKELALMLKNNSSLISMDLRDNEGLTKQYSRYIYKKLVINMEKYKQQKELKNRTVLKAPPAESNISLSECANCKKKTFEKLRLQKKNLDLQMQLRRIKNAILSKNIDLSGILKEQSSIVEWLSNKSSNQNDDELLQRMEQIMMELTRVIETIEQNQHTKVNYSNPLDNPNSFSNTVQLYSKNSQLQDLSRSIEEENRLQALFEASMLDRKESSRS